jgi:hypothetical protein
MIISLDFALRKKIQIMPINQKLFIGLFVEERSDGHVLRQRYAKHPAAIPQNLELTR